MIGIRIADGSFFPVLEENSGRRKLVLTAANKGQDKVRIDFVSGNYHLGTIFLDDIRDDSDIELVMESVGKTLIATATDTRTGNRGILNAVLPDAVPEAEPVKPSMKSGPEKKAEARPEPEPVKKSGKDMHREAGCCSSTDRTVRGLMVLLIIMTTLLTFLAGAAVYALVNIPVVLERGSVTMFSEPASVPASVPDAEPVPEPEKPAVTPEPEPEIKAEAVPEPVPAPESRPTFRCGGHHPPVRYRGCPYPGHRMPPVIPPQPAYYVPEYIRYKVKYGDTLWSIARTFCTDPYMYLEIARENRIADPTKIYPGTILMIRVR